MRKKLVVLFLLVVMITVCVACNSTTYYSEYFLNFESQGAYTSATATLVLEDGIYVASYNSTYDVYVTQEGIADTSGSYTTLYGFCSSTEVLMAPRYTAVLDICGEYAIVEKQVASGGDIATKIGIVKYTGENSGAEFGFSYEVNSAINQYTFLDGQYLAVIGDITNTGDSSEFLYATIYDYSTADGEELLKIGMLTNVTLYSSFFMNDGYIAVSGPNNVRFHTMSNIVNGYFVVDELYIAFSSESMSTEATVCSVYYAGNGWYVVSSVYSATTEYDGYEMVIYDDDDVANYTSITAYKYSAKLGRGYSISDRVVLVANEYNDSFMRTISNAYNDIVDEGEFANGTFAYYYTPVVPLSSAVADGYSLVYYYYYYYVDSNMYWAVSFSLYDAAFERTDLDVLLPLLYVDEVGISNADPNFDLPITSAMYYNIDTSITILATVEEKIGYDTILCHDGAVIVGQFSLSTLTTMLGAYDVDGTQLIPFIYAELSPYFGEYCTGSQYDYNSTTGDINKYFYRIDRNGKATELENVYGLGNGVYITQIDDLYGLYANDGTELIPTGCDYISIIDSFLVDGVYISTVIVTEEDGHGVIYSLNS